MAASCLWLLFYLSYGLCGGYVSPYNIARVYGAIDDMPRALERLVSAYREHNPDLIELTHEPSFAGLHSDAKNAYLGISGLRNL